MFHDLRAPTVGTTGALDRPDSTLVAQLTATAAARPASTATVHNGRSATYTELIERARVFADRLGGRPGRVAVDAVHAPATIAALLGTWLAGGAYCPVDPAFPAERRKAMLAAAGCGLPGSGPQPAYILFTSGSTGVPKPVLTGQAAIATTVAALRDLFEIGVDDRVLQFASLNWDTCFEEILPTLTAGATLVFDDDAYAGSFPKFVRMLERERITVADLPTAYWHELVNFLVEEGRDLPETLRLLIIGGEAASPARLADWSRMDTGRIRLLNTYGCTETTLITHAVDLCGPRAPRRPPDWSRTSRVPIGRALPHVVEWISDDGELFIGGPALADGYAALDPIQRFTDIAGQRLFRTGDRVSRRADGILVHEGRADDTLKIRGVRIDPAEVEAHIATHPAVGAVAVIGLPRGDHTVLTAFVVPRPPASTTDLVQNILDHLRDRVPAHLVPSRIWLVAELAYTASGKVDRRRIKETLA